MSAMTSEELAWLRAGQSEISVKYARGPWTHMDYIVWSSTYNLGDISGWPVDAVLVQEGPHKKYLLGSLQSAADLCLLAAGDAGEGRR